MDEVERMEKEMVRWGLDPQDETDVHAYVEQYVKLTGALRVKGDPYEQAARQVLRERARNTKLAEVQKKEKMTAMDWLKVAYATEAEPKPKSPEKDMQDMTPTELLRKAYRG